MSDLIAWESTTPCYIRFVTQKRYEMFSAAVKKWYRPFYCSGCSHSIGKEQVDD